MSTMSDDTVKVAVRIRPLVKTELERGCRSCLGVVPGEPQIQIFNSDKAFTYNYVFSPNINQEDFYNTAVKGVVANIFQGYNVTILAYGQTGSGKTYSMGTDYTDSENTGIIPRAVHDLFNMIARKTDWQFKVTVSFMELYQEQLYDLLSDKARSQSTVDIREDGKGIRIHGLTEISVSNAQETLQCLLQGATGRVTGATAMNAQSSRSHAIFTLCIQQQKQNDPNTATTAKFHLVDLAGSERSKKTLATGERFKEGVNINKGLLALGNVISQLGEGGSASYIGYRDSKLTRLLQDSLGGNSMTLMIACVSPADYNIDETLSTLRYADRARKIKNKPIVNQDPKVSEINRLNKLVAELRSALVNREVSVACHGDLTELEEKNRSLQEKLRDLTEKLNANLIEIVLMHEKAELAEQAREKIKADMAEILVDWANLLSSFDTDPADLTDIRSKLEIIYRKILDIQNDQNKASEDLLNHEISLGSSSLKNLNDNKDNSKNSQDSSICLDDFDEKQEEHTMRQAETNEEVQNINKELAIKEQLVFQLLKNSTQTIEYYKELQEMEQEVQKLQNEKEELMQALRNAQTNTVTSKLSEARRKKVQELEKKIADLQKKCVEQNRVIKMKEKSDQQMKNLSNEIQSLKRARVQLVRQMRTEANSFTKWKQAREKELYKLQDQDRKRVNQMERLRFQHNKQQNVLKRKMEEAYAVNKRLKEALDMQKRAMQRREKMNNSKEEINSWVKQELEVLLSTIDAEICLQKLMRDRTTLAVQLDKLKSNEDASEQEKTELTEFIDLRNTQISDLQQKIVESDQENKANTRWHLIQTMTDAKTALKSLFEIIAEDRKNQCKKEFEYKELQEKYERVLHEKTKLEERIEMYEVNCNLEQQVLSENSSNINKKGSSGKSKNVNKETDNTYDKNVSVFEQLSDDSFVDDLEKDPDWKKTPLYKRVHKLMRESTMKNPAERSTLKRSSDGDVKCSCKTKCSTRLCSCRKNDVICSNCNCNPAICQNKEQENLARTLFPDFEDYPQTEESKRRKRSRLTIQE